MAFEYRLHDVGEGTDAGEIIEWHVGVGDEVKEDQPLVDVQTDKAIVVIPCPTDGILLELRWAVGDMVPVGEVLAVFGDRSDLESAGGGEPAVEDGSTTGDGRAGPTGGAEVAAAELPGAPPPGPAPGEAPAKTSANGGGQEQVPGRAVTPAEAAAAAASAAGRPLASPAVRRLAREQGVDLASVSGSGRGGRIVREDVAGATEGAEAGAPAVADGQRAPRAAAPSPDAPARQDEVVPLRGTRRAIARNLTRSWREIPHIVDFRETDATRLLAARGTLRSQAEARGNAELAAVLTPLSLVAKIAATVVRRHPRANSSVDMEREEITLHGAVGLSIAIAAPDGLVTPVVRDADQKPLPVIAGEIAALAAAAKERRLTPEQFAGGTLTVNNFGALGSPFSTPIIPPGQAANLGLGRIQEKPVARDGEVVIRPILGISCSGDHRALDGEDLSYFVNDIVAAIEDPVLLLGELA